MPIAAARTSKTRADRNRRRQFTPIPNRITSHMTRRSRPAAGDVREHEIGPARVFGNRSRNAPPPAETSTPPRLSQTNPHPHPLPLRVQNRRHPRRTARLAAPCRMILNVIGEAAARKTPIQFGGLSPSPRPACSAFAVPCFTSFRSCLFTQPLEYRFRSLSPEIRYSDISKSSQGFLEKRPYASQSLPLRPEKCPWTLEITTIVPAGITP